MQANYTHRSNKVREFPCNIESEKPPECNRHQREGQRKGPESQENWRKDIFCGRTLQMDRRRREVEFE